MIWTAEFWKGLAERAVKTFFQTGVSVAVIGAGQDAIGVSAGILDVDWATTGSVAILAALLSAATSIGNADFTSGGPAEDDGLDLDAIPEAEAVSVSEDDLSEGR